MYVEPLLLITFDGKISDSDTSHENIPIDCLAAENNI